MAQRSDQVFQLSLTEIAFTIAFMLLLLLGYLVFKEQTARIIAEEKVKNIQSTESAKRELDAARAALVAALRDSGASNPDDAITKLVAAENGRAERDRQKKQIDDLNAQLTALTELQKQIDQAAQTGKDRVTKEEIHAALVLQDQLRKLTGDAIRSPEGTKEQRNKQVVERVKQALAASEALKQQVKAQLNREIQTGQEPQTILDIVSAAKSFDSLAKSSGSPEQVKKENTDLRGQVEFLKNRLNARGGLDYPPCWADEKGKVEFLFAIELKPDSVVVAQDWPANRESDARMLPGLSGVLSDSPHSFANFPNRIQDIFNWSKKKDPQCRHYVHLKSSIADAVQSDRARLMIENFFYKVESRR